MKRIPLILVLIGIIACSIFTEEIVVDLPFDASTLRTDVSKAQFSGTPIFGLAGEPALPVYTVTLLLPPDADPKTVSAAIISATEISLTGRYVVAPVLAYVTSDGLKAYEPKKHIRDGKDLDVYSADALFPKNYIRFVQPGQLRDYKLLDIAVQRFKYNPVSGKLIHLKSGKLVVNYKTLGERVSLDHGTTAYAMNLVKERTVNYTAMIPRYAQLRALQKTTYAILTTASIQSASAELANFVAIRKNEGYNVIVVTESNWGGGTGSTAVTNIRNWLKNNYQSQGIEYVFILGDPSSNSPVAMTPGPTASDKTPLIDYCYADLTGSDSDIRDTKYYEYGDEGITQNRYDKYAEVHVGRIPVYNNSITDLDFCLKKIVRYITETKEQAESWRLICFMPLHTFGDAQSGWIFGEYVKSKILEPNKWKWFRLYDDHMGVGAEGYPCSYANTKKYWSAGKFGIMVCQGHGTVTSADQTMDVSTAKALTDAYPAHCFNVSCNNGKPDDAGNLGFAEFKYAGISSITSAVQIWYNQSTASYGTATGGNDFAYVYLKHLVASKLPAAAAFDKGRSELPISGTSDWQNCTELNLYGCPATGIFTYGVSSVTNSVNPGNSIAGKISFKAASSHAGTSVQFFIVNDTYEYGTIRIYSVSGSLIETISLNKKAQTALWEISDKAVARGMYIAKMSFNDTAGKGFSAQQKLILK